MKNFISKTQKIGELGEGVACRFLEKNGFTVIERNHTQKWGEIDIISKKENTLHFIEVKSASRILDDDSNLETPNSVPRVTKNFFRPEENMHPQKKRRLGRTIETYLIHNRIGNTTWQFDILLVYLDLKNKRAKVDVLENIIL